MDAIIFLAPISAFDQVLAEAPKVNRLVSYLNSFFFYTMQTVTLQEDSVMLWTSIVSNKLLKDTNLILFLNKCDIMKTKLASGIKLRDYVVSYGNRPNDFDSASSCEYRSYGAIRHPFI